MKQYILESKGADDITDPKTGKYYNGSNNGYAFIFLLGCKYKNLDKRFFIGDTMSGHAAICGELAYRILASQGYSPCADYKNSVENVGLQGNIVHFINNFSEDGKGRQGKFHKSGFGKNGGVDSKRYNIEMVAKELLNRQRDIDGRLFINGDKVEGFDGYNIVAIHRPKEHLSPQIVVKIGKLIEQTKGLNPSSLAFKLGDSEFIPYDTILQRGFVYDQADKRTDDEDYSKYLKTNKKNKYKSPYTEKQWQKLKDYGESPDYNREGEQKYLRGDDKDYYGSKEWKQLKYADKPGYMTKAEYNWRTKLDEELIHKVVKRVIAKINECI